MWPEPLPLEVEATDMKTMVIHIANAPKKPEDAADYHQLWANLVNRITIPETFTCIFNVIGRTANTEYYYCMATRSIVTSLQQTKDIYNVVLSL